MDWSLRVQNNIHKRFFTLKPISSHVLIYYNILVNLSPIKSHLWLVYSLEVTENSSGGAKHDGRSVCPGQPAASAASRQAHHSWKTRSLRWAIVAFYIKHCFFLFSQKLLHTFIMLVFRFHFFLFFFFFTLAIIYFTALALFVSFVWLNTNITHHLYTLYSIQGL